MMFCDKLIQLRKIHGYSQEQLADALGVTRQSVSKWEANQAKPEIAKLIMLSNIFSVSIDYLVKDEIESMTIETTPSHSNEDEIVAQKLDEIAKYMRGYEYTSKKMLFGVPLISIRLGRQINKQGVAKGIIAIGNIAIGVVSIGAVSIGIVSLGALSFGLLSLGAVAFGLLAFGAAALGIFAAGAAAVGVFSWGVASYGHNIAIGVAAKGTTALGRDTAEGIHTLLLSRNVMEGEIRNFIAEHNPNVWKPFLEFLVKLAKLI